MFIPKRYGQSKRQDCPFCNKPALKENTQGIPTCQAHQTTNLPDLKCMCGSWLELRKGDWGPYFNCTNCGNLSFAKAMARSTPAPGSQQPQLPEKKNTPTHIVVRSDDPLYTD
jgi:hypothetical protein